MFYPTNSGVKLYVEMADVPPADIEQPLFVRDLCGRTLAEIPSTGAWTLDRLIARLDEPACANASRPPVAPTHISGRSGSEAPKSDAARTHAAARPVRPPYDA